MRGQFSSIHVRWLLLFYSYQSPSSNPSTRQLSSTDERSSAIRQHTSRSLLDPASSPGSLSMDPTPIPSPQPSFTSSMRSARSSGRGSGRKRQHNHSPSHMSSGSEDTLKVGNNISTETVLCNYVHPSCTCIDDAERYVHVHVCRRREYGVKGVNIDLCPN